MKTTIIATLTAAAALAVLILTVRNGGPQPAAVGAFAALVASALAAAASIEDAIEEAETRREMMRRVIWPAHLAYMRDPQ